MLPLIGVAMFPLANEYWMVYKVVGLKTPAFEDSFL